MRQQPLKERGLRGEKLQLHEQPRHDEALAPR
jgi:hypothetical protein